ncbi:MAG TPA: isocitrate lyase/phosphoenolpyruvate mutase family protein [Pedomonas sp.]|uniref:isocitrate lyase/PEP mutase family protein n=1 Tax=Pedomonas sp. TaxID=2976421 RepID=UPI002F404DA6
MADQKTKAEQFKALHVAGKPLVLFNVWDAGSARAVAATQTPALATSSWAVAAAHGLADGEKLPLNLVIANLQRIVAAVDLPVSIDIESGYDDPAKTVERAIEAGAIGANMEDSLPQDGTLREVSQQVARIRKARCAADALGIPFFLNARTDVFFQKGASNSDASLMQSAIERAKAYADAGADGLFIPGLTDVERVAELVAASTLPVNVMLDANVPDPGEFAQAGVARVSYGPAPYLLMMKALENSAGQTLKAWRPN